MPEIEKRTMDKVTWRLVPFLMLCYFIAYLDRVNVGFAGGSMSKDLALSAGAFGGAPFTQPCPASTVPHRRHAMAAFVHH